MLTNLSSISFSLSQLAKTAFYLSLGYFFCQAAQLASAYAAFLGALVGN